MSKNDVKDFTLDAVDLRLLRELQIDASWSNQALAQRVHVSPATCLRRVRRMEMLGVIHRRVALLNPDRLGPTVEVVCEVTLDRQGQEHLEAFEALVAAHDAIRQCYRVSPGPDLILIASVPNIPAWADVAATLFTQHANVRNVKSFFVVRRVKFETATALPAAAPPRLP